MKKNMNQFIQDKKKEWSSDFLTANEEEAVKE